MRRKRACDLCYKKKIQCDGDGTQCDWCTHHDLVCTYNRPSKKRTASATGTSDQSLSKRIERLELILNAAKQLGHAQEGDPGHKPSADVTQKLDRLLRISEAPETHESTPGHDPAGDEGLLDDAGNDFQVFHLGKFYLAGYHIGGIGSRNCLPSFSPAGYDWIYSKTGEEPRFDKLRRLEESWGKQFLRSRNPSPGVGAAPGPADNVMPSRILIEDLVSKFFVSDAFQSFPVIERKLFQQVIETVYSPANAIVRMKAEVARAALFALLALASLMADPHSLQPASNTQIYFNLALKSLTLLIAEPGVVQCGTLVCLSLFSALSGHEYQATMLHSLACRALMMLHAHTASPRFPLDSTVDSEATKIYLRKLFWVIYTIDKEVSCRSGLPPSFADDFLDLTLPGAPMGQDPTNEPSYQGNLGLVENIAQGILKSKICRMLFSETAFQKSEVEILTNVRQLDEELEQWRLSVPVEWRPGLSHSEASSESGDDGGSPVSFDNTHVTIVTLGYYHLLSAVHRASGRCRAWPGMDVSELEGISSSLAISVHASRLALRLIRKSSDLLYKHSFWVVVFYPMSAMLAIFCSVLLDPLDPQAAKDLAEIAAIPEVLRKLRQRGGTTREDAFLDMVEELCAELVRLGNSQLLRQATGRRPTHLPKQSSDAHSTHLSSALSTHAALRSAPKSPNSGDHHKTNPQQNQNPEMPTVSLSELGLSKNMRLVLIVILSVFGTIETWFYCQALWRWWQGKKAEKAVNDEME
ncbi:ABC-transporter-regulating transcription factor [Paramyrothecium foliicola]|nr:ABC-transporter-regulating transcription factor [Paramyrothecium foliicola]